MSKQLFEELQEQLHAAMQDPNATNFVLDVQLRERGFGEDKNTIYTKAKIN